MENLGVPAEPQIYVGTWTNWSHGKIFGATLTLTQTNGSFLVAFLALFVSFSGTSFFRISCFVLHHVLSSNKPSDALYHQIQAILRNSASGTTAFLSFFQLLWSQSESRNSRRPVTRVLPILLHSAIIIGAFAVAGIYSSRITSLTGDEVLIWSPVQGPVNFTNQTTDLETVTKVFGRYMSKRNNAFANYAQDCYTNANSTPGNCKTFVKTHLPRTIDRNASCPFDPRLCRSNYGNVRIDTGFLDSHWDLGINAPEPQRIRIRNVLHCSPLVTEGHVVYHNQSDDKLSIPYFSYYYGPIVQDDNSIAFNETHVEMEQTIWQDRVKRGLTEYPRYGLAYVCNP